MNSIGTRIKKERIKQGVSLENIASITKIRVDVLKRIEDDDFKNLPPKLYVRGFLIAISNVLGLNSDEILENYLACINEGPAKQIKDKEKNKTGVTKIKKEIVHEDLQKEIMTTVNSSAPVMLNSEDGYIADEKPALQDKIISFLSEGRKKIMVASLTGLGLFFLIFFLFYLGSGSDKKTSKTLHVEEEGSVEKQIEVREETIEEPQLVLKEEKQSNPLSESKQEEKKSEMALPVKEDNTLNEYSLLKIQARGGSWVKLQLDDTEVASMTFIVGMTRVFKVYRQVRLFLGNSSNLDIYFNDEKLAFSNIESDRVLNLKHAPLKSKPGVKKITVEKKPQIKLDEDLISPPKLTPEKLTL